MYTKNFLQVGTNIKKILEKNGMTQQALADKLGVSKQVMNKIIKGLKAINVSELASIASILNVTTDSLLTVEYDTACVTNLNFMGEIKNIEESERIKFVCSAIDDIMFLEELLNER